MALATGDLLADGWTVERLGADGSVRFVRSPSADRRRATSRLIVMAGCLAVVAALSGVSAQSHDSLWLLTWSLVALFGLTSLLAALAAVKDLRRASIGVFLEIDASAQRVRGVIDGAALRQFSVTIAERPLSAVAFKLVPFEDSPHGAGMLVCELAAGERLLAPDLPQVEAARPWFDALRRRQSGS